MRTRCSPHTASMPAIAIALLAAGQARTQTITFGWRFADAAFAPITEAQSGDSGYLILDMQVSPLAGLLPVTDPARTFGGISGIVGSVVTTNIEFQPSPVDLGEADMFLADLFGPGLVGFLPDGGDIIQNGRSVVGFTAVGPPSLAAWDASRSFERVVAAWSVTFRGHGLSSVQVMGRGAGGTITDDPFVSFGMFAGRAIGSRVLLDTSNAQAFSSLDVTVITNDGWITIAPSPATTVAGPLVLLATGRRRRTSPTPCR